LVSETQTAGVRNRMLRRIFGPKRDEEKVA
jgi:hypothetical protein